MRVALLNPASCKVWSIACSNYFLILYDLLSYDIAFLPFAKREVFSWIKVGSVLYTDLIHKALWIHWFSFNIPYMFSGPDSMLQKLLLQLGIFMHFQSFIGRLLTIRIIFHVLHDYQIVMWYWFSEIDAAKTAGWTLPCAVSKPGVIFIVFDTAIYLAIVPKR